MGTQKKPTVKAEQVHLTMNTADAEKLLALLTHALHGGGLKAAARKPTVK